MTNSIKLESALKRQGLTKRDTAKKMGLSEMGLHNKISNQSEFKASEIMFLSSLLKLSEREKNAIFFATNSDFNSL